MTETTIPSGIPRLDLAVQRVTAFVNATEARHPGMDEFAREFEGDDHTRTVDLFLSDLRELIGQANSQPVLELIRRLQAITPVAHGTLFVMPGEADDRNVEILMGILTALNGHAGFALVRVDENDTPALLSEERMAELGWVRRPF
jgi:hypothetical protein